VRCTACSWPAAGNARKPSDPRRRQTRRMALSKGAARVEGRVRTHQSYASQRHRSNSSHAGSNFDPPRTRIRRAVRCTACSWPAAGNARRPSDPRRRQTRQMALSKGAARVEGRVRTPQSYASQRHRSNSSHTGSDFDPPRTRIRRAVRGTACSWPAAGNARKPSDPRRHQTRQMALSKGAARVEGPRELGASHASAPKQILSFSERGRHRLFPPPLLRRTLHRLHGKS